jgi:hypothetical protein
MDEATLRRIVKEEIRAARTDIAKAVWDLVISRPKGGLFDRARTAKAWQWITGAYRHAELLRITPRDQA